MGMARVTVRALSGRREREQIEKLKKQGNQSSQQMEMGMGSFGFKHPSS